jgi:hypothetical protein
VQDNLELLHFRAIRNFDLTRREGTKLVGAGRAPKLNCQDLNKCFKALLRLFTGELKVLAEKFSLYRMQDETLKAQCVFAKTGEFGEVESERALAQTIARPLILRLESYPT